MEKVSDRTRERLRSAALELGFTRVGFAPAEPPAHAEAYIRWLDEGHHGEMAWMARPDAVRRRLDPREALPGCRTLIVAALSYAPAGPDGAGGAAGSEDVSAETPGGDPIVARYARGRDYHEWFEEKLDALAAEVRMIDPDADVKRYVDYGPVLERDHAQRAGLGWIGKNTMLIDPELGSWLLLGELLTTLKIEPDEPFTADRCGSCRRCIEACPTDAILEHRAVDARRCISYLTIELKGSIPVELRPAIGTRVFGCDICQDVCPWNSDPAPGDPEALAEGRPATFPTLAAWAARLLDLDAAAYRETYRGTPLARPGRDAMLRNLCVGLGNSGEPNAARVLRRCLADDAELVREHAAWALGRLELANGSTNKSKAERGEVIKSATLPEPVALTEAQRAHLANLLRRLVDESREEQERWAAASPNADERAVRDELTELRRAAAQAARALGLSLQAGPPDPRRRIGAWATTWWSHVLDARPSALRRFGEVNPEAANRVGPLVADLAARLRRLQALVEARSDEGSEP